MFKPVRLVATLIMLGCFVMVWVSVFVLDIGALAIIFCILLYLSYLFYCLSYIPYAHTFLKNFFSRLF